LDDINRNVIIDRVDGIDGVDVMEVLKGDFEGQLGDFNICSFIVSATFSSSKVSLSILLPFGSLWQSFSLQLDDLLLDDIVYSLTREFSDRPIGL